MDKSSNGTFVNNVQIGRNNRAMLKPMDEVTLLPTKYARYMYKEREQAEDDVPGGPSADYFIQKTLVYKKKVKKLENVNKNKIFF